MLPWDLGLLMSLDVEGNFLWCPRQLDLGPGLIILCRSHVCAIQSQILLIISSLFKDCVDRLFRAPRKYLFDFSPSLYLLDFSLLAGFLPRLLLYSSISAGTCVISISLLFITAAFFSFSMVFFNASSLISIMFK